MIILGGYGLLLCFCGLTAWLCYRYEIRRVTTTAEGHEVFLHALRRKLGFLNGFYSICFILLIFLITTDPEFKRLMASLREILIDWGVSLQWRRAIFVTVFMLFYSLIIMPGFMWIAYYHYRLEKQVRATTWSFGTAFLHFTRDFALIIIPIMLWNLITLYIPNNDTALYLSFCCFIVILFALSPALIRMLQRTEPLTDMQLAERISDLCDRAGMKRCAVHVWFITGGKVVNAVISGIFPFFRHIFITDRLIKELPFDEIEAVIAHEIGHIRKKHLWGYLSLSIIYAVITPRLLAFVFALPFFPKADYWQILVLIGWMATFFGILFGLFSRHFEKQADAYAVMLTGNRTSYLSMLNNLARLNHIPGKWGKTEITQTHPSIQKRISFIEGLKL